MQKEELGDRKQEGKEDGEKKRESIYDTNGVIGKGKKKRKLVKGERNKHEQEVWRWKIKGIKIREMERGGGQFLA